MSWFAARVAWLPPLVRPLLRRGRRPGLRTTKTTLAAVLSFVVAERLGTSTQPVLASLTALLVVQLTMYQTLAQGMQRVVSVAAGVLVAVGVASFVGLTWWSLGAVVAASLLIGRVLRLGPQLLEVPISAMLVLALGRAAEDAALGRVYETLIGAAIAVLVNLVIAPPLYAQPANDALSELADRMSQFVLDLAAELRAGWTRAAADRWLGRARALGGEVARADETLGRAEESARFNPRGGQAREIQPRLRIALTGLELCYVSLRSLCRALLDRAYFVPVEEETVYTADVRTALADVMDSTADALRHVVQVIAATESPDPARADVAAALVQLQQRRDHLSSLLLVDPHADAGAWEQHGALLSAVDRLRVEVEATVRAPTSEWRPEPVTERQRQAVRRIVDARAARRDTRRRRKP